MSAWQPSANTANVANHIPVAFVPRMAPIDVHTCTSANASAA
jgi:hypothetical protein